MSNIIHNSILSILSCTLLAAPATAQVALPAGPMLPTNQLFRVGQQLRSWQISQAFRTALNSTGDTLAVNLNASGSIAIIAYANLGGRTSFDAVVKRTDGGFEVTIGATLAQTIGFEVFSGLEINALRGHKKKVIFSFSDVDSAALGMRFMALLRAAPPRTLAVLSAANTRLYSAARTAVTTARRLLTAARRAEATAYTSFRRASSAYQTAYNRYERARVAWIAADRKLRDARRTASRLGPLSEPARLLVNAAARTFRASQRAYDHAGRVFRAAQTQFLRTKDIHRRAQAETKRRYEEVSRLNRQMATTWHRNFDIQRFRNAMQAPTATLLRSLKGVEFEVFTGVELQASVSLPGISLQNLGVGVTAQSFVGGSVRLDFPINGRQTALTIKLYHDLTARAHAGALVGFNGSAKLKLCATTVWNKGANGRFGLDSAKSNTSVTVDMQMAGVFGVWWTLEHGVGRKMEVKVDFDTWANLANATPALASNPSIAGVIAALGNVQATVTIQDRWTAGLRSNIGASYAGYGASFGGAVTWNDQGVKWSMPLNAAEMVRIVTNPGTIRQMGAALWVRTFAIR